MPDLEKLLTTKQIAELLAILTPSLRDLVHAGEIAFISVGRGTERRQMSLHPRNIGDFINRRRTRMTSAVRPKTAHATISTSSYPENGFTARRAARIAAKEEASDDNDFSAQRQTRIAVRKAEKHEA
jgi:excisionase family DNA binding protein